MDNARELVSQNDLLMILMDFIGASSGLSAKRLDQECVMLSQKADSKMLKIKVTDLLDILLRKDPEGKEFLQVNFTSGTKILITDQLVGFRPMAAGDLDLGKLPKVVTTLDLMSVIEAIEECASAQGAGTEADDLNTLKKVFGAIVGGGEAIGFDLSQEKSWLKRLPSNFVRASA